MKGDWIHPYWKKMLFCAQNGSDGSGGNMGTEFIYSIHLILGIYVFSMPQQDVLLSSFKGSVQSKQGGNKEKDSEQ